MKLFLIIALIISVNNYGPIPAEGMDITLNQPEIDILTGEPFFKLDGQLTCTTTLNVSITRSAANLTDEFCCAGECTFGNEQMTESRQFTPGGETSWFVHYTPQTGSDVHISYLFSDETDSRELRVHYVYNTEGIEITNHKSQITNRKVLRDNHVYILTNQYTYQIL